MTKMIEKNIKKVNGQVTVVPCDDIYRKLGNNSYTFIQILCELIDNALAARASNVVNVRVNLFYKEESDKKRDLVRVEITDDGKGIEIADLAHALSPGANSTVDGLNEHGMGLKQAVAALGRLDHLTTKTKDAPKATLIDTLKYGAIDLYEVEEFREHGTTISAHVLTATHPYTRKERITKHLVPYLGAVYRYFLKPSHRLMNLTVALIEEGATDADQIWDVNEVRPIYHHPKRATNAPVIQCYPLKGDGWYAELTFGYAPTDAQLVQDLGMEPLPNYHPYRVSLNHQGIDVLVRNRVVLFHQLKDLNIVNSLHPQYNHIRGELNLISGFSTTVTKNGIKNTRAYQECLEQVAAILQGKVGINGSEPKDYLKTTTIPDALPEALLTNRLFTLLDELEIYEDLYQELPIEGVGRVDILGTQANGKGKIFELKTGASTAQDVFQLLMYMFFQNVWSGELVAAKHTTGAIYARDSLVKRFKEQFKLDISIKLNTHDKYHLDKPADAKEREAFFGGSKGKVSSKTA